MANITRALADNATLKQLAIALLALGVGVVGGLLVAIGNPIIPFAILAAVLPLPWLLTRPMAAVMLVLAIATLLPFGTLPFNLGVTPALIELALLLALGVIILQQARAADGGVIRTPLDWWLLLFLGSIGFAFILGLGRDASTTILHNFFKLLLAITFFFTATQVLRTLSQLRIVTQALTILGGLSALLGLVLYALPDAISERLLRALRVVGYPTDRVLRFVEDDPAKGQRATGTSVDPNSFGGLILAIFAITLVQLISKRPLLPRPLLLFFLAAESVALVLTSRGAFLGAVAVVGFVGILRYRKLVLIGGAAGVLALALGVGSSYVARLQSGLRFEDQAQLMRLAEYQNAIDIIVRYPAFGVGFGRAGELDLTTGVSSVYLTLAERAGLFGLGTFLLCMGVFFSLLLPWLLGRALRPETAPARTPASVQAPTPAPLTPTLSQKGRGGTLATLATRNSQLATPSVSSVSSVVNSRNSELDSILLSASAAVVGALVVSIGDHYYFNIEYPHMVALMWLCVALGLAARRLLMLDYSEQKEQ